MQKLNAIIIDGTRYPSVKNAAKELNIPRRTLRDHLNRNAETPGSIIEKRSKGRPKHVVYKGKTYDTVKLFAEHFDLSYAAVKKQFQRGKTAEEIIEHHNKKTTKGVVKKYGRRTSKKKSL